MGHSPCICTIVILLRGLEVGAFLGGVPSLELPDRFPVVNRLEVGVVFSSGFVDCFDVVANAFETLGLLFALDNRGATPGDHWVLFGF